MKQENYTSLSTEELLKKKKTTAMVVGLLIGVLLVLFAINIALVIKKGFNAGIVTTFAFLPILIIIYQQLQNINKELESRNDK